MRPSSTAAVSLVVLAVALGTPGPGSAQAPLGVGMLASPAPPTLSGDKVGVLSFSEFGGTADNRLLLQPLVTQAQGRKSAAAAFGLELVLPIVGHAYAGNARRGILPAVFYVGGFVGLLAQAGDDGFIESGAGAYAALGALLGGRIWGLVSAVRTANDHNRSLSSGNASLTLLPTPDGGLGVGMNFRL